MHVFIHDYAGHPFQAELSRELAGRGHRVTHAYFAGDTGPKGRLTCDENDPETLSFLPLGSSISYSKTNFVQRRNGDLSYGQELGKAVLELRPDVVISGNTPTEAQEPLVKECQKHRIAFVYWCQDFYSIAASQILQKKLSFMGAAIGAYYRFLERRQMRSAAHIIHITEAFRDQTHRWGISNDKVSVIPNWGAIDEIAVLDRETEWAKEQDLSADPRFIYSGTLALKHNPALLSGLARSIEGAGQLVLVSAGTGAENLAAQADKLPALKCLPLQPFEIFEQVLGSADVLLAVIEREAGMFSVPSKILSYLCAGKPIVLAAPKENLAAQILISTGAGTVVEPEDEAGFTAVALQYLSDPNKAKEAGLAGRRYAEDNFVISKVADRFEAALETSMAG